MKISMLWGESLVVSIPETGDEFYVRYGADQDGNGGITVRTKLEDESDRGGVIFSNSVNDDADEDSSDAPEETNGSDKIVRTLLCNSCGLEFVLTEGEQQFMQRTFGDKYKDPVRCRACRKARTVRRHRSGG